MTKHALKMLAIMTVLALAATAQTLPAGTHVTVRLTSELSSATAKAGQTWDGTVAKDVVANGQTLAKAGTPVKGTVVSAKPSGRLKNPGVLSLRLSSVGGSAVHTMSLVRQGESHKKSNVTKIGGGAAAGAVIGGIAGGGKGAAIGTMAGGAAGTGAAAYTGKKDVVLPAESALTFTVSGTSAAKRGTATKKK